MICTSFKAMDGNESGQPASWKTLTSYLANITESGKMFTIFLCKNQWHF